MTHATRAASAARVAREVRDALGEGVDVRVVEQAGPPSAAAQRANFVACLSVAEGHPLLFLEDDVRVVHSRLLRHALPVLVDLTCLCLVERGCIPAYGRQALRDAGSRPVPVRVAPVERPEAWGGSQALFLPAGMAEDVLAFAEGRSGWASDTLVRAFVRERLAPGAFATVVPNPVQHLDLASLLTPGRRGPLRAPLADLVPMGG